jgi:glycine dehydrogenase subunit 2
MLASAPPSKPGRGRARKVVLVPESAHGTNPATAALSATGSRTSPDRRRRVDLEDLKAQARARRRGIMITNPNTCGLFEPRHEGDRAAVHEAGGYFYCDGANFNAIVGKVRPGDLGVDAMHINLHKTFSTPHGGGGPGPGPVVLSERWRPSRRCPTCASTATASSTCSRRSRPRSFAEEHFGGRRASAA